MSEFVMLSAILEQDQEKFRLYKSRRISGFTAAKDFIFPGEKVIFSHLVQNFWKPASFNNLSIH